MGNELYERYEKLRDIKGYTDYKVAKLAGIKGTATISNWKNGKYTPKDDKMQAIASVLDVTFDYLKGNTDMVVCPICGFGDNPLSEQSHQEHLQFHAKFTDIQRKYPFFMNYAKADKLRTDSIFAFRNPANDYDQKQIAFEKYLQASFSLEIIRNNYEIEHLDYYEYCRYEVGSLSPDDLISQDFIDILIQNYGVDTSYIQDSSYLLARTSDNPQLMRILAYAEKLNPGMLDAIEIQLKALAEQNPKE